LGGSHETATEWLLPGHEGPTHESSDVRARLLATLEADLAGSFIPGTRFVRPVVGGESEGIHAPIPVRRGRKSEAIRARRVCGYCRNSA
jgi:hypothetical protein